jgi:hypothetical protein
MVFRLPKAERVLTVNIILHSFKSEWDGYGNELLQTYSIGGRTSGAPRGPRGFDSRRK